MLLLSACATQNPQVSVVDQAASVNQDPSLHPDDENDFLDDSAFDDANLISEHPIADPLEGWNRMWFAFNDVLWLDVFKPVYHGYETVVHEDIRSGLSHALDNLKAPVRIVNSVLQLEFAQAMVEFGRFLINTTFGGGGLLEIVPPEKALVPINLASADFGGTLARWGVGEGLYIIWPVIGPSTLRDSAGFVGDTVASAPFWLTKPTGPVSPWITYPTTSTLYFNRAGGMIKGYETLTKAAIEPYTSLRDAYVKMRRNALLPAGAW